MKPNRTERDDLERSGGADAGDLAAALLESEERFRTVVDSLGEGLVITDLEDVITYVNARVCAMSGFTADELIGRVAHEALLPSEEHERMRGELALRAQGLSNRYEVRYRRRDGARFWLEVNAVPFRAQSGEVIGTLALLEDVTERKESAEENLRLAALSRENPSPVLECDGSGDPIRFNPAAEGIVRSLDLPSVRGLLPENHDELVAACIANEQGYGNVEVEVGGRIFAWTYHPYPRSRTVHLFAVDITSRRKMEEQLRHDALHDALTGLPNRLLFMERLTHAIHRAERHPDTLFAVLFLDLDRFKVINDSLGHHVGDELLVIVAKRLEGCLRPMDTVARFGGDEFAILLEEVHEVTDVTRISERIQGELSMPVKLGGFDVFTSASIGVALSSIGYERPEYLLRNADMAMYRAKAAGQARVEIFDREMHAEAVARLQLETDLRRAVDRGEFLLHFQPIVWLDENRIVAVEALVRWAHPERGLLLPECFVSVAEETGLIGRIGEWVLRDACSRVRAWRARFPAFAKLGIAINLSAKQLSAIDLVAEVRAALEESGLHPSGLKLEITESAVMHNAEEAIDILGELKSLGVKLYVDDFGTGYSSLSYLHRFPLDALKIDRSFVGRMEADERARQLVETVLGLAQGMGVDVVAEGIETEGQLAILRQLGCGMGQGHLFAEPLPPEALEKLLDAAGRT